ncbi:MAG: hypothetical protein VXZ73_02475 [Pseudomonadota bacterium]|nr:hypothetical protein [Pseudomonadota bacterium]
MQPEDRILAILRHPTLDATQQNERLTALAYIFIRFNIVSRSHSNQLFQTLSNLSILKIDELQQLSQIIQNFQIRDRDNNDTWFDPIGLHSRTKTLQLRNNVEIEYFPKTIFLNDLHATSFNRYHHIKKQLASYISQLAKIKKNVLTQATRIVLGFSKKPFPEHNITDCMVTIKSFLMDECTHKLFNTISLNMQNTPKKKLSPTKIPSKHLQKAIPYYYANSQQNIHHSPSSSLIDHPTGQKALAAKTS